MNSINLSVYEQILIYYPIFSWTYSKFLVIFKSLPQFSELILFLRKIRHSKLLVSLGYQFPYDIALGFLFASMYESFKVFSIDDRSERAVIDD